jgi:hypothetical protein
MQIDVIDFVPCSKKQFRGYLTVCLPDCLGMIIQGCALHEKDGKRWIELPAKPPSGKSKTDKWSKFISFPNSIAQKQFNAMALKALDDYLSQNDDQPGEFGQNDSQDVQDQ